jgi:hypothetical protein
LIWVRAKYAVADKVMTFRFSDVEIITNTAPVNVTKIHNYWGFGLCPSSGILESRKHYISETGSVSVLR